MRPELIQQATRQDPQTQIQAPQLAVAASPVSIVGTPEDTVEQRMAKDLAAFGGMAVKAVDTYQAGQKKVADEADAERAFADQARAPSQAPVFSGQETTEYHNNRIKAFGLVKLAEMKAALHEAKDKFATDPDILKKNPQAALDEVYQSKMAGLSEISPALAGMIFPELTKELGVIRPQMDEALRKAKAADDLTTARTAAQTVPAEAGVDAATSEGWRVWTALPNANTMRALRERGEDLLAQGKFAEAALLFNTRQKDKDGKETGPTLAQIASVHYGDEAEKIRALTHRAVEMGEAQQKSIDAFNKQEEAAADDRAEAEIEEARLKGASAEALRAAIYQRWPEPTMRRAQLLEKVEKHYADDLNYQSLIEHAAAGSPAVQTAKEEDRKKALARYTSERLDGLVFDPANPTKAVAVFQDLLKMGEALGLREDGDYTLLAKKFKNLERMSVGADGQLAPDLKLGMALYDALSDTPNSKRLMGLVFQRQEDRDFLQFMRDQRGVMGDAEAARRAQELLNPDNVAKAREFRRSQKLTGIGMLAKVYDLEGYFEHLQRSPELIKYADDLAQRVSLVYQTPEEFAREFERLATSELITIEAPEGESWKLDRMALMKPKLLGPEYEKKENYTALVLGFLDEMNEAAHDGKLDPEIVKLANGQRISVRMIPGISDTLALYAGTTQIRKVSTQDMQQVYLDRQDRLGVNGQRKGWYQFGTAINSQQRPDADAPSIYASAEEWKAYRERQAAKAAPASDDPNAPAWSADPAKPRSMESRSERKARERLEAEAKKQAGTAGEAAWETVQKANESRAAALFKSYANADAQAKAANDRNVTISAPLKLATKSGEVTISTFSPKAPVAKREYMDRFALLRKAPPPPPKPTEADRKAAASVGLPIAMPQTAIGAK